MKFTKLKKILVSLFALFMCFSEIKAENINKIEFIEMNEFPTKQLQCYQI